MITIEITCQECGCLFQVEVEEDAKNWDAECPQCGNDVQVVVDSLSQG